jgi:hypothetical protein
MSSDLQFYCLQYYSLTILSLPILVDEEKTEKKKREGFESVLDRLDHFVNEIICTAGFLIVTGPEENNYNRFCTLPEHLR